MAEDPEPGGFIREPVASSSNEVTGMPTLGPDGNSNSWLSSKTNVLRIFNEFLQELKRKKHPIGDKKFSELDATVLCNKKFWEYFSGFLTKTYKKKKRRETDDDALGIDTARNYFSTMVNLAKQQCFRIETKRNKVLASTKYFFTCLDVNGKSEMSRWLQKMKKNIVRYLFERGCKEGVTLDNSVSPVYEHHVQIMVKALTNHGYSYQNSYRKLVFCCLRFTTGRSGEMSWLLLESFEWDSYFRQVFGELPESKTSRMKLCAFVASPKPELCFFTNLGEVLTHKNPRFLTNGKVVPLFRQLQKRSKPGTKICEWIAQLRSSANGLYKDVSSDQLNTATAQGI